MLTIILYADETQLRRYLRSNKTHLRLFQIYFTYNLSISFVIYI